MTTLFRLVFSSKVITEKELEQLRKKDPGIDLFIHPIPESPLYRFRGDDGLYTFKEMRQVIASDPLSILKVYESSHNVSGNENREHMPRHSLGEMDGKTALLKFD